MSGVPETDASGKPSIDLAREFVGAEGRFKGHAQGVAPPAVEVARSAEPHDDFFADENIQLVAQARFAPGGRERQEARAELGRRRGLVKAQETQRSKRAEEAAKFRNRLTQIKTMDSEAIERLEAGAWYRNLPLAKREQVDEAITEAISSGLAYFGTDEPADEAPDVAVAEEDDSEALNEWLDDETGQVEDPTGRGDESLDPELLVDPDELHLLAEDV